MWVKNCDVCVRCKHQQSVPAGLLQPFPISNQSWQHISIDFIKQLPKFKRKDVILVVVCKLTKYGHFFAVSYPFTAAMVAQLFLDTIFKLHDMPYLLYLTRTKCSQVFSRKSSLKLSNFIKLFYCLPSINKQLNREVELVCGRFLGCMTHHQPITWCKWLSLAPHTITTLRCRHLRLYMDTNQGPFQFLAVNSLLCKLVLMCCRRD